jgi:hypothetical protein
MVIPNVGLWKRMKDWNRIPYVRESFMSESRSHHKHLRNGIARYQLHNSEQYERN